jgi:hypothetical protein
VQRARRIAGDDQGDRRDGRGDDTGEPVDDGRRGRGDHGEADRSRHESGRRRLAANDPGGQCERGESRRRRDEGQRERGKGRRATGDVHAAAGIKMQVSRYMKFISCKK